MLNAIDEVFQFVEGHGFDQFDADKLRKYAVVQRMEVIGEAAKCIPQQMRAAYPQIPWRRLTGIRDRLAHGYFDIDYAVVWTMATDVFPIVRPELERVLRELGHLND